MKSSNYKNLIYSFDDIFDRMQKSNSKKVVRGSSLMV